jgi:hypothetical protein
MKHISLIHISLIAGVVLCGQNPVSAADPSRAAAVQPSTVGEMPGKVIQSWLANSFSRDKGHHSVPVNIAGIAVTPDGTVFSAGVAEGYGGVASYKDGQFVTKYDYDSGFGSSASAVAVDDSYVYIGTGVGLFRTRRGDESYNRTPITGGKISGLALFDGELYLSDSAAGKIRVLATATMKEVRSFAAPRPGTIAVGANSRVWVIQGKPGEEAFYTGGLKVISFSKEGQPGPEIADFENPCALALDLKGRLLVGGLNRHSQVWIYDVSGMPKRVGIFGTEGGIFSGEPGRYEPKKFHWIRGIGLDTNGNLYVGSEFGSWYNVLIEAYAPSGQRLWNVYGLGNWLDTACTDPAVENIVYTKENVFTMDWSRPPGSEQSLAGLTVDRFKYPLDCRVTDLHGPSHRLINGVRRIGGKLFLYCGAQGTGSLEIYKFGEGCVAVPCGYVAGASTWRPENGKRWPEDGETFIWTDRNGNGAPDPAEFASVERKPRWGFMHLDAAAGIWQCAGEKTIFHLPCEGLDGSGNPVYRRASEVTYQYPPEFTGDRLRRLFYIPGDDVLIAGGSPGTEENACNMLICFEHWSDQARRAKRWTINLPLNDKSYTPNTGYGGGAPLAMQACGKYLFVAYGYGLVRVHRLDNGGYVGTIRPDINGFKGSGGCVDSDNALNVTLRKNGEYVLFLENAGLNHVMMFRWAPPSEGVNAPGDFVPLFSAEALKSWRQCGPGRFVVTKGVAAGEGGMGLWWYAGRQFTNFVLRGEFVQEQDIADSGVFLRFPDPGQDPWIAVHLGHEMEIGDPEPRDPTWRTGSIYPFQASTRANTKPLGQWNEYEIICQGQTYTVRMNGEQIMTWADPKQRTGSGYIGLQNYNDGKTVSHRNVRIKDLP